MTARLWERDGKTDKDLRTGSEDYVYRLTKMWSFVNRPNFFSVVTLTTAADRECQKAMVRVQQAKEFT